MLNIQIRRSNLLAAWIIVWPLLVAVAIWFSALSVVIKIAIDVAIAAYAWALWRQHITTVDTGCLGYNDGHWYWREQGEQERLRLEGEYYLSRWLISLVFRREQLDGRRGKKRVVIILPDNTTADERRQLRVLLRFGLSAEKSRNDGQAANANKISAKPISAKPMVSKPKTHAEVSTT